MTRKGGQQGLGLILGVSQHSFLPKLRGLEPPKPFKMGSRNPT